MESSVDGLLKKINKLIFTSINPFFILIKVYHVSATTKSFEPSPPTECVNVMTFEFKFSHDSDIVPMKQYKYRIGYIFITLK